MGLTVLARLAMFSMHSGKIVLKKLINDLINKRVSVIDLTNKTKT